MESRYRVLIMVDDPARRALIEKALESREFRIILAKADQDDLDDIIAGDLDLAFLGIEGHGDRYSGVLLKALGQKSPPTPCIIMAGGRSEHEAMEALGQGASDYVLSTDTPLRVMAAASRAMAGRQWEQELGMARSQLRQCLFALEPAGVSGLSLSLKADMEKAAHMEGNVLIQGERGTGKLKAALSIHSMSPRQDRPFVSMGCDLMPRSLVETELLGRETGSYGGRARVRKGRLELAAGGTLFIDDIHLLRPGVQDILLSTIRTGKVERVGGSSPGHADARIIASTTADLEALVYSGGFLKELYDALSGVRITLPPLRHRRDDIPMLLKRFLEEFSEGRATGPPEVERGAMRKLQEYHWPGNTEELRSLAEGLSHLGGSATVTASDLPDMIRLGVENDGDEKRGMLELLASVSIPGEGISLPKMAESLEKALIAKALDRAGGNQGEAARLLGLKRTTLLGKLRKWEIS